ncbi:PXMP2/4 family protein 4 [Eucalyptus grandis]|uniref:PXMP2/4 family protein 4 n=1 Tax=Eucalyptus grandis TaxID=71139 RepID=UPI00192F0DC6|nr:PXMP2/4 family protein 4 [Eucalyptus grandis]
MASLLRRKNPALLCSLHKQAITHSVAKGYSIPRACRHSPENQTSSARAYFRPRRFSRKAREYHPSPAASFSSSSPASSRVGFVSWYLGMVKSRPVFTKSVTCGLIYTAADLSSQTLAKSSSESYDLVRTLRMAGYGMLILGPSLHFWFNCMSRHFPKQDLASTLKKMVMGETLYGPAMTVVFFCVNAGLQGENGTQIVARLKRDLIPTLVNGFVYWPFCDFITFRFTPVHLQPLVSNSFSYIWTIYLTYMASLQKVDSTAKLTTEAAISPPQ